MALQLEKDYKGIKASYWTITNIQYLKKNNRTFVSLSLFVDKDSRTASLDNSLLSTDFLFDGQILNIADLYEAIKESKLEAKEVTVTDEEGNITTNTIMVETNEFVDAIDC